MIHGGDVYTYKGVKLDFSVNVNPYGPPKAVLEFLKSSEFLELQKRYPRLYPRELEARLRDILGKEVLVGPGSCFLIYALASLFPGKRVLTLAPSFVEYERAARAYGCLVKFHNLREDMDFRVCLGELVATTLDADIVFLCNPNNPTGRFMDPDELEGYFRWTMERGIFVVLDEAFIDFVSFDGPIKYTENVVVIRSFTKSYGIPGVRLGYVFGSKAILDKLRSRIPPWPLGGGVEEIGILCLESGSFLRESLERINKEKAFVFKGLIDAGFKVFPSSCNFFLFKAYEGLFKSLLDRGILVRKCNTFKGLSGEFFRVSVRRREENERLVNTLKKLP